MIPKSVRTDTAPIFGKRVVVHYLSGGRIDPIVSVWALAIASGCDRHAAHREMDALPAALRRRQITFDRAGAKTVGVPVGWVDELARLAEAKVPAALRPMWRLARAQVDAQAAGGVS